MDAIAAATFFPMHALLGRRVCEAGIPGEGDRDGAAVHQVDDQAVIVEADVQNAFVGHMGVGDFSRNIHAISPRTSRDVRPSVG